MVGTIMPLCGVCEGGQAEQEVSGCLLEAGTLMLVKHLESWPALFSSSSIAGSLRAHHRALVLSGPGAVLA